MSSAAPAVKAALVTALTSAFGTTVQVNYGPPGSAQSDDIIAVLDVRVTEVVATMGNRSREETLEIDVVVSSYRGGGTEIQQTVTERAYAVLAALETYLKTTDPSIGGTVRSNAGVIRHDMNEDSFATGRVTEIAATVLAFARI